jgi:hypothetical protein
LILDDGDVVGKADVGAEELIDPVEDARVPLGELEG